MRLSTRLQTDGCFNSTKNAGMHSWRRLQHHPGIIPGCVSCSPASRRGKSDQQETPAADAFTIPEPLAPEHELDALNPVSRRSTMAEASRPAQRSRRCITHFRDLRWSPRHRLLRPRRGLDSAHCCDRQSSSQHAGHGAGPAARASRGRSCIAWQRARRRPPVRCGSLRAIGAAESVGVRAVLVHAISNAAKTFYEKHGLRVSPVEPMTLMITIEEARGMLR